MKKNNKIQLFEVSLFSIGCGWLMKDYPNYLFDFVSYGMIGIGSLGICYHFFQEKIDKILKDILPLTPNKKFDNFFLGSGIKNKDGLTPKYLKAEQTTNGYKIYFTLPSGLSSYDFNKCSNAFCQYLDVKKVDFIYANNMIIADIHDNSLETSYDFELTHTRYKVPIIIGYSINKIETLDLSTGEPHLLIAGESGSGKSTLLRGIITNLIYNTKIKLHLIDLKNGAEFQIFEKCKTVISFSKTIEEAQKILYKINNEIDRRYQLFYDNNCVDINEYNKERKNKKLDRQIVIVDEFADLQDQKDSIKILETISAKARACGIHLIISTQRPDAKILNGRIKANIPRIIGLKCMNEINSRIIIDHPGLENLRGKGHGILKSDGKEIEIQAMNITSSQAKELVQSFYINKKKTKAIKQSDGEVKDLNFLDKL